MRRFPLALQLTARAVRPPSAWFIPGPDPAVWLDEVARWGVATAELWLFVLPHSPGDRTAVGVFVLPPDGVTPRGVLRGLPYGRLGPRLFLPVDATLSPPVSESELGDLLPLDVQVLHPSTGLVGFVAGEALRTHELLARPALREFPWDRAVPAAVGGERLVAVEPAEVPGPGDVLEAGRGDIGSATPGALPPRGEESTIKDLARRAAVPPLKLLRGIRIGGLGRWASAKLAGVTKALEDARFRELERLRRMLEKDPDEGLRHAIPLRDVATRGRATPGWRLASRDVNFNLSKLSGSTTAGDPWSVPPNRYQELLRRYREAANRELRLGRYRRAAYVFAELLGDFAAAANALEQGRHYREASILYREQLKNPPRGAECLERGGLLQEAAAAFESLQMYERAGDVHARLEQRDDALRCYRRQVDAELRCGEFMSAAKLLEAKLQEPDEALAVLSAAWPESEAAGACLRESFALLARLGRHEAALARLGMLRARVPPTGKGETLTQVLAHVATTYPEGKVRAAGADVTRVVASVLLPEVGSADRQAIARAVARLAPEDRLLSRDVERFLAKPRERAPAAAPPPLTRREARAAGDPVVVRQFRLPDGVDWKAVAAEGAGFYALGVSPGGMVVFVRGLWNGRQQQSWARRKPGPGSVGDVNWRIQPVPGAAQVTVTPALDLLLPFTLPSSDAMPGRLEVASPSWLGPQPLLAIAHGGNGMTWVLRDPTPAGLTLGILRSDTGALVGSHALTFSAPKPEPEAVDMVAHSEHVVASWGSALLVFGPTGLHIEPTSSPVSCVAASPPDDRVMFAAGVRDGGLLVIVDGENVSSADAADCPTAASMRPSVLVVRFGDGLERPLVAFTRRGLLVAVDGTTGRVYRTDGDAPRRRGDFLVSPPRPLAVTRTDRLDGFALFTIDGNVTVYQVPA